ncbi:DUF7594 domain-containing protein [Dactylosporangium sp. CA-152071]|uniref:CBM96 family carbohydrate-binding protein n=1 Tax=Dactylosporangium sp. CA-152071 TaxID=3239933 RepID=UPI003D92595D
MSVADPTRSRATVTVTLQKSAFGLLSAEQADGIHVLSSDHRGTVLLVEVGGAHGATRTVDLAQRADPPTPRTSRLLMPSADTYVQDGKQAGTTFGTSAYLAVKKSGDGRGDTGYSRRALLTFDARQVTGRVRRAVLWLNGRTADSGGRQTQVQAFSIGSTWTDRTVTWRSAPPMSTPLGTGWVTDRTDWVGLDVTGAFATATARSRSRSGSRRTSPGSWPASTAQTQGTPYRHWRLSANHRREDRAGSSWSRGRPGSAEPPAG